MPVHLVSGADIKALAIVGKGANRKRFFLTKAEGEQAEPLPSVERLVKADDWSAVYCVVAEPGWHESAGVGPGADQSIDDRWASEDEIRKAAHRFMANGGLVTKMHESLEPFGQLVENAVALADFDVDGETIRKGSWYVAIEPTAEGREAIEKGEFTGVSIEGLAVRELVEKAELEKAKATVDHAALDAHLLHPEKGTLLKKTAGAALPGLDKSPKENWVDQAGGLPDLIDRAARHLHSEKGRTISAAIATAVNWAKKGCASGTAFGGKVKVGKAAQAAMCKAVAEWEAKKKAARVKKGKGDTFETTEGVDAWLATLDGSAPGNPTVKTVEKTLLRKLAEKVGISKEELDNIEAEAEAVAKANLTFGGIVTQREFEDALPDAFSAFRESVYRAFFPQPEEDFDPVAHVTQSCDEFKDWCLAMLDKVPVAKEERAEALGVEVTPDGSTIETRKKDGDMGLTDAETARIEKMETAIKGLEGLPAAMAALAKAVGAPVADEDTPTAESVAKALTDLPAPTDPAYADRLAKVEADIKKLGEGNTSQSEDGNEPVQKKDAEAIAKAYKEQGVSPALAGVLN